MRDGEIYDVHIRSLKYGLQVCPELRDVIFSRLRLGACSVSVEYDLDFSLVCNSPPAFEVRGADLA
jgi:hypothetical protein